MPTEAQSWPDAGKPGQSSSAAFKPPHDNPNATEHAFLGTQDQKEGGKDMGLVHAPIVSMYPSSTDAKAKAGEFHVIDNANFKLNHYIHEQGHFDIKYPFEQLTVNQGMFIPVEEGSLTDKLINSIFKMVDQYRKQNSEVERDENGDDVMEDVAINTKKRNEDGTIQLDGDVPRLSIKSGFRPKLIGPNFAVKAVVKGDKIDGEENEADGDGVLVIRMS